MLLRSSAYLSRDVRKKYARHCRWNPRVTRMGHMRKLEVSMVEIAWLVLAMVTPIDAEKFD
jgi:hypothetical protein